MKKYLLSVLSTLLILTANAQWLNQNAGFANDTLGFYEMSIVNKKTAWAICYDGKAGLFSNRLVLDFTRTKNGGDTWIAGKMGNDSSLQFSNISAISEKEAWVAMHKLNGALGGGLYHTTDGGTSWTQSNAGKIFDNNSFPNFVYFKDDKKGIAMGDPNGGYFEIYTTNNGGKKWKRVPQADLPAPLVNEFGFISGYTASGNTIWFGTLSGRMYKSTNFGKTWTAHTVDPAGNGVYEIAFNDDKLHGVTHVRTSTQTLLYATTDGGLSWINLGIPANWKSSRITAVPGTNAFVSTSVIRSNQGSAVSYDNGATWTELERTAPKAVARFLDAETGWSGGFFITGPPFVGGIYKSQIAFQIPPCPEKDDQLIATETNTESISGLYLKEKIRIAGAVQVYPSPARDIVTISLPEALVTAHSAISLLSLDGQVKESVKSTGRKSIQLNVSKLTAGAYMVRIAANGHTINKLITIAR
jgi:photosystem II stability/assembly factor-like uncharacterized protein